MFSDQLLSGAVLRSKATQVNLFGAFISTQELEQGFPGKPLPLGNVSVATVGRTCHASQLEQHCLTFLSMRCRFDIQHHTSSMASRIVLYRSKGAAGWDAGREQHSAF
jgi:hypothetical protein